MTRRIFMKHRLGCIAGVAALAGAATLGLGLASVTLPQHWITTADAAQSGAVSGPLGALIGARRWLNTQPLRPQDLRGKVVLVNFWTYSCINSLRALPYTRAWADRYKESGLAVIGVHTPEFAFERDAGNVEKALVSLGVSYPVALDNDYGIWGAFDNQGWPGFYFIGRDGSVRDQKLGEGDYDQSERLIQKLLSEAGGAPATGAISTISGTGPEAAPDFKDLRSPETYIGYDKASNFASRGGVHKDAASAYQTASTLSLNQWGLSGTWTVGSEFATLDDASGSITYRFHARDLHLVLAPAAPGRAIRFRVKIDGAPPGVDHGFDVDSDGLGSVAEPRMYQLIRQTGAIGDRNFEIQFLDPGVRAYVFTFG